MSKVLFLDVDGVLHPNGAVMEMSDGTISSIKAFRWLDILIKCLDGFPDIEVVLHSSWRHGWPVIEDLKKMLPKYLASKVVGVTPLDTFDRYPSILEYIDNHQVTDYVIVDDDKYAFPLGLATLVLCDSNTGLSDPDVEGKLYAALSAITFQK